MTASPANQFDALIVGYGPVGATLANLLGRMGLSVLVVDQSTSVYDKPRAISFDHEIMRIFQAAGIAGEIDAITAPHTGTDFVGVDGKPIWRLDVTPPPYPLGWFPTKVFVQPLLEKILRERAGAYRATEVRLGRRLTGFTQRPDGISARIVAGSAEEEVRAGYLLACDGASSFVRKFSGIAQEDLGFDEWWVVVDTLISSDANLPRKITQFCQPERPHTFVLGPGNLRRWEIKLLPGETPADYAEHDALVALLGTLTDLAGTEIWRAAAYQFHALVAERWRDRRVFILGDAAHQMPPFLAQGLCAGIRDTGNLAWKLAMVERMGADDSLLDTYETERKPHIRDVVASAKRAGLIIGELDRDKALARDAHLRKDLESGGAVTNRQRLIPDLKDGLLARNPDGTLAGCAGSLFVQPSIQQPGAPPRFLDDVVGSGMLIASLAEDVATWLSPESRDLWQRMGGNIAVIDAAGGAGRDGVFHLAERDGLFADWCRENGCLAAIARPDRYVYGVASDAGTLDRLVGELGKAVFGMTDNEKTRRTASAAH